MSDLNEHEMIERLIEGTRTAAGHVMTLCQDMSNGRLARPTVLADLRKNLNEAAASAGQLGHAQRNPDFFAVRDQLNEAAVGIWSVSFSNSPKAGLALSRLGTVLDMLWREAKRMSEALSVPGQEVLAKIDARQRAVSNG